jgi:hypothetical protein
MMPLDSQIQAKCRAIEMQAIAEIQEELDYERIRMSRRWAKFKEILPNPFLFATLIVLTGRLPAVPQNIA